MEMQMDMDMEMEMEMEMGMEMEMEMEIEIEIDLVGLGNSLGVNVIFPSGKFLLRLRLCLFTLPSFLPNVYFTLPTTCVLRFRQRLFYVSDNFSDNVSVNVSDNVSDATRPVVPGARAPRARKQSLRNVSVTFPWPQSLPEPFGSNPLGRC